MVIFLAGFGLEAKNQSFNKIFVCISFSLPDQTLKSYFHQAQEIGAHLVMRGLYKNSFQATKEKMEDLKINVLVDPNIFESFAVKVVPTVVALQDKTAFLISGNVSLKIALEQIVEENASQ
tara:strand:- start:604 stop:966 length:363 start_codon:yes stop_codon:yes gene_type:complete